MNEKKKEKKWTGNGLTCRVVLRGDKELRGVALGAEECELH